MKLLLEFKSWLTSVIVGILGALAIAGLVLLIPFGILASLVFGFAGFFDIRGTK
jgi:hypothetical protein